MNFVQKYEDHVLSTFTAPLPPFRLVNSLFSLPTYIFNLAGSEVLTAVVMMSSISWDYNALIADSRCFLLGLFFDPEDGGDMFLRNVG
jgi:hypothetical protein